MNKIRQIQSTSILFLCIVVTFTACKKEQQEPAPIKKIQQTCLFPTGDENEMDDLKTIILDFPTAIKVYYGEIINEISFMYEKDELFLGNNSGKSEEFHLEKGEYIVEVSGTALNAEMDEVAKQLFSEIHFITNSGRSFKVQSGMLSESNDWNRFIYKAQEGNAVFGLYGTKEPSVTSIGFFEDKIPDLPVEDNNSNIMKMKMIAALAILFVLIILITILILKKKRYRF